MLKAIGMVLGLSIASVANAHPGGLNAAGCHTNRKTGEYHCHRAPSSSFGSVPLKSQSKINETKSGPNEVKIDGPFRNCTEARAMGAAPVRRGELGYGLHLDRDRDGVGCE